MWLLLHAINIWAYSHRWWAWLYNGTWNSTSQHDGYFFDPLLFTNLKNNFRYYFFL